MSRASGQWDLEPVIKMLKDEEDMIPIKNIARYQQKIERLDTLSDGDRDFLSCIRFVKQLSDPDSVNDEEDAQNTK